MRIAISFDDSPLAEERPIEIVERKGLGHPDSICDAVAEELSLELCRFYQERVGRILHHNVDKVLLAAGRSRPRFGGGEVLEPIRILFAGRAVLSGPGFETPIAELAERAARAWIGRHLHALDADRHLRVESLIQPGSSDLVDLFEGGGPAASLANDTSCGIGFAPLSPLERLVLRVEQALQTPEVRRLHPALGEDVKVMAVRDGAQVDLTVSVAMIDAELRDLEDYRRAIETASELALEAARHEPALEPTLRVNAADDIEAGRVYLTVTGTSAEAGDDGQTGRGNRVNGLITPGRPMTMESVAGKNPVTHVGKLYNLAASLVAERLVAELPGLRGAECRLVSQIGRPIEEPQLVELRLWGAQAHSATTPEAVHEIARDQLVRLPELAPRLLDGTLRLDRWPLGETR